ncbi:MAG TPA: DUF1839 family protein [Gemmataceae bacterium]|jgi:hypothetical protein|nr:DUF1839 family protein [Gemmataceae bacterium]
MIEILPLDPARYERHPIHGEGRIWAETNCFVDLWVELIHASGMEPIAALPFTLAIDFEGDQWTFFKFPFGDLDRLFGLDVQELAIWRPLAQHLDEQLRRGRHVLVELDSFWLPDTAGTAYQREHTKTTIGVNALDLESRSLGYFHNQGYYRLEGEDFERLLRLGEARGPGNLPPYTEFAKRRDSSPPRGRDLIDASIECLRRQLRLVPASNPFPRFKERFEADLAWLTRESLETFHQYSFATLRQFGACYELASTYLRWLEAADSRPSLGVAATALEKIATEAKALQFQLARCVSRKKPLDLGPIDGLAEAWKIALETVVAVYR